MPDCYNRDKKTLLKRCLIGCAVLLAGMGGMTAVLKAADSRKTVETSAVTEDVTVK